LRPFIEFQNGTIKGLLTQVVADGWETFFGSTDKNGVSTHIKVALTQPDATLPFRI